MQDQRVIVFERSYAANENLDELTMRSSSQHLVLVGELLQFDRLVP